MLVEENGNLANVDGLRRRAEQIVTGYQDSLDGLSHDDVLQLITGLLNRVTELEEQNEEIHHELESIKLLNNHAGDSPQVNDDTYRNIVRTTCDAIVSTNNVGDIIYWNKAASTIFGYTEDEIIGKPISTIMPERFQADHCYGMERVVSTGKTHILGKSVEMVGLNNEGDEFPVELSLSSWEFGEEIFFTGIIRDIKERKHLEEELRSLARFPRENRNPVMRVSHNGVILYANEASSSLLNYWDRQVGQKLPVPWRKLLADAANTAESYTTYVNCNERIYELDLVPNVDAGYINLYGKDDTERKQTEVLLEQQNQFITTVFDSIRDPLYVVNVSDYSIQMSNPSVKSATTTCYSVNHRKNKPCSQLGYQCPVEEAKITKKPAIAEHIHYDLDGNQRFVELHAHPIINNQGEVTQVIEYILDITERKQMELAVKESEAKWRSLTQYSPDHIVMLDPDLTIQFLNYASPGLSEDELIGIPIWKLVEEERQLEIKEILEQVQKTGEPDHYETQYYIPNGDTIFYESYVTPIKVDDQLKGLVISARDITERKKIEAVLRERTEALGERIKELNCLYSISAFVEQPDKSLPEIIEGTVELIPLAWKYPGVTEARIILGEQEYKTNNFDEHSPWIMAADIVVHGQTEGRMEVCYLERRTKSEKVPFLKDERRFKSSEGPFLIDERSLLDAIAGRLGKVVERLRAEEALQKSHANLGRRVKERTADLDKANQALLNEVMERKRAYEAEQKARQTAEILQQASLTLSKNLDLTTVMGLFLDYAYQLVPHKCARVFLIDDETHLSIRAECGPGKSETKTALQIDPADDPIIHKLVKQQKSILILDTKSDSNSLHPKLNWKSVRSWVGIPLIAEKKTIGICIFEDSESQAFSEEQVQLIEILVGLVTVNIQNAWLFEQVRSGRERLQSLSRRLVEAQESERRYISRELHDEAGQALTSLMVGLRLIERDAYDPESVLVGATELKIIAERVIGNLHRLAMNLRPASLDHLGLVATLRQYVEEISERQNMVVQFEVIEFEKRLPPKMETAIYRIVQEALSNVILHAQASRVDVLIEKRDDKIVIIVEDNGIGMDTLAAAQAERLGLIGMQERADTLGGNLTIESQVGVGTTLYLEVPYGD